ncbi:zinc-ribbon domain-containing protein, partial [Myxococcota bacterium]
MVKPRGIVARMARSLASTHRKISRQWHPTKNGDLTPRNVSAGSERYVWWRCPEGPDHEWQATVRHRAKSTDRCPFCSDRRVSVTNSLAALHPDIAAMWHSRRNGKLKPGDVLPRSGKRVWWRCDEGHAYTAKVRERVEDDVGCWKCHQLYSEKDGSLADLHPELSMEWHPTKNGRMTPRSV